MLPSTSLFDTSSMRINYLYFVFFDNIVNIALINRQSKQYLVENILKIYPI